MNRQRRRVTEWWRRREKGGKGGWRGVSRERPEVGEGQLQFLQSLVSGDVAGGRAALSLDDNGARGTESWSVNIVITHLLLSFTHASSAHSSYACFATHVEVHDFNWSALSSTFAPHHVGNGGAGRRRVFRG